ncbi:MAG: potassium channel family protein [Candidatus Micrarchaeia archaeon]
MSSHAAFEHVKDSNQPIDRRLFWVVAVLIILYGISIVDYVQVEKLSYVDAFFETVCTSVYVECGSFSHISTKVLRVLLGMVGAVFLIFLISTLLQSFLKTEFGGMKMKKKISKMKDHYIICGYGELGRTLTNVLAENKKQFVVIDNDINIVNKLKEDGFSTLLGDALESDTLSDAGIDKAKFVIAALRSDADNVFLTLTATENNPKIKVATRAYNEASIGKLHSAGAEFIVMPDIIGGYELASKILNIKDSKKTDIISRRKNNQTK